MKWARRSAREEMARRMTYRDRGGDDLGCRVGRLLVLRLFVSYVLMA